MQGSRDWTRLFSPPGFPRFLGFDSKTMQGSFSPSFRVWYTMDSKTVQRSALCRSRRELSNAYLLAKFGFDRAENKPSKASLSARPRTPAVPFARRPHAGLQRAPRWPQFAKLASFAKRVVKDTVLFGMLTQPRTGYFDLPCVRQQQARERSIVVVKECVCA